MQKSLLITALFLFIVSFTGCKKPEIVEPKPTISFRFIQAEYGIFGFEATSTDADTYKWDFGDGSTDNTLSPIHAYKKNGSFNVSVTATGKGGSTTTSRTVAVSTVEGGLTFWTDKGNYSIDVTVDNKYLNTIKSNYASVPNCGASGTAYFASLKEGTHTFTAKEVGRAFPNTWTGSVNVVGGECLRWKLGY